MTVFPFHRRLRTCGCLLPLMAIVHLPFAAVAETSLAQPISEAAGRHPVIEAVINHPSVASSRALICRAASQFDQARSQELPQVDFSLGGNSSLSSRARTDDTESRRLEHKNVDAQINLSQTIFDWGQSDADKQIALNEKVHNTIGMRLEIDRVAADILDLTLKISEHSERRQLIEDYIAELTPIEERLEASINAGVLRLGDLRAIKIIQLDAEIIHSLVDRQIMLATSELQNRRGA